MANQDRPKGFIPYGNIISTRVAKAGATVRAGEFVKASADGKVDPVSAGDAILGLALNNAADTEKVLICDNPNQLYVGQSSSGDIDAQTDINNVADVLATGDNTTYLAARMEIDGSSIGQGSSKQLLIVELEDRPDNALGSSADVIVKVNEKQDTDSFVGV